MLPSSVRTAESNRKNSPGKDLASEKPWTLFTGGLPTFFASQEKFPPSLAVGGLVESLPRLQIPNKSIFAVEITGSLFVLDLQHISRNIFLHMQSEN